MALSAGAAILNFSPMNTDNTVTENSSRALGGIVRAAIAVSIIALAGLAILFVLDIIPRDQFTNLSVKTLAVGAIALVSGAALSLLTRR